MLSNSTKFFSAIVVWDDEDNIEENHLQRLFCEYESEDDLRDSDPKDEDIFHYGLSFERAKLIIGKTGSESGEGEFTIVDVIC